MPQAYQPIGAGIFSAENIRNCQEHVLSVQRRLDEMVANSDKEGIRQTFNLLTRKSKAVRILAVRNITQDNKGKYTAGVDGIAIDKQTDKQSQYQMRLQLLEEIDIRKKPDKIRRVYIPKANGKKRPLGIPTLHDRIVQEIYRTAIEPIAEYHFSDNSFGFRPKRSCHDAIDMLHKKLCKSDRNRFVVEGDIKGCFDNINHDYIIQTLEDWLVPKWATQIIKNMLQANIFFNGEVYDSERGTPQGGVISPLLANVALTTLDDFCSEKYGKPNYIKGKKSRINPIVRYADDFVITCKSELEGIRIKEEIAEHLQNKVGLTLSDEKTEITCITKGFDFIGFNIRKYPIRGRPNPNNDKWGNKVLLIKPQKEKALNLYRSCKELLNKHKTAKQVSIILLLNQKIRGWGMFYRHVVSQETFTQLDFKIWHSTLKWCKRRHPNKSTDWIVRKYYKKFEDKTSAYFIDKESGTKLYRLSRIPIKRFDKIKNGMRVYDKDPHTIAYWEKREYTNAFNQIQSVRISNLYKRQNGVCPYCKGQMTQRQIQESVLHVHHMKPRSLGGSETYSNLKLLHNECHRELHATITRTEMCELSAKGIDYIKSEPFKESNV